MPNGGDLLDDHTTPGYSWLTMANWQASHPHMRYDDNDCFGKMKMSCLSNWHCNWLNLIYDYFYLATHCAWLFLYAVCIWLIVVKCCLWCFSTDCWHFISFMLAVSELFRTVVIGICVATACRQVWKWCNIICYLPESAYKEALLWHVKTWSNAKLWSEYQTKSL